MLGLHAVAGAEVGVVHDDVRVRYASDVVVVVHDGVLAQRRQVDVVAGVLREHEVLERVRGLSTPGGLLALRSISQRCAEHIGDAARILEAQNEILYAEERANAKPCGNER